jgi:hypothetical protein
LENPLRLKVPSAPEAANDIALKYITYLAAEPEKLWAFCNQSGLDADSLKQRLGDAAFHAFVLDQLLQDESELLCFAAATELPPDSIMRARAKLPGFGQ